MLAPEIDPASLAGLEIVDRRGERLGRVRQVYPDGESIGWAGIRGNLIGTTEALVPLTGAVLEGDVIQLPITRARFLSAPRRTPDAPLTEDERDSLARFYEAPPAVAVVAPEPGAADDRSGDDAPAEVVRSEQRLVVSTEPVPRTRVVLRKVVVTEQRTVTVPVRREEMRLVREPIEDAAAVAEGADRSVFTETELDFVLHEERVVVTTEVVPVERIRLVREVVAAPREVVGEVWREQVDAGPAAAPPPPGRGGTPRAVPGAAPDVAFVAPAAPAPPADSDPD